MNTGGTIPAPVLDRMPEAFAHAAVVLNYGLTETYRTSYLPPEQFASHRHTIGRAIPGVQVAIVRDDGTLAEPGEPGQIVHRGDFVCLGYWNDPHATAAAIRPDPLAPQDQTDPPGAMFTGDLGMIDEQGMLHFLGRRDNMLKSMGVRVCPGEVEELLWDSGLVSQCAVFGRKHDLLGDEIWAAVVPKRPGDDPTTSLKAYARQAMSPFMQPRRYIVKMDLPKTTTGKIDYPALRAEADDMPSASVT
jgi:acyl-coenzyme A synthetase/AMP-(fatty) acid ligase